MCQVLNYLNFSLGPDMARGVRPARFLYCTLENIPISNFKKAKNNKVKDKIIDKNGPNTATYNCVLDIISSVSKNIWFKLLKKTRLNRSTNRAQFLVVGRN